MSAVLTEALAALYALAPKCDFCEEHVATREGVERSVGLWCICDRDACASKRGQSMVWADREHAAALRAANAAHEALS